jgi:DNA topoisomerase-3
LKLQYDELLSEFAYSFKLRHYHTAPPPYLSEAELIGLMEKNGIGTDASIPTHINNIEKRAYVTIQSGRRVAPTDLGVTLIQGRVVLVDPG